MADTTLSARDIAAEAAAVARECQAAILPDPSSPTYFQQLDSLAHVSHILVRAHMEAAFGPRRVHELLSNSRSYIQKQIDELAVPIRGAE